jgi:hypothetical protein
MRLQLSVLAIGIFLSSNIKAHEGKQIDQGAYDSPMLQHHQDALLARQFSNKHLSPAPLLANEIATVDVAVVMHSDWLETMKIRYTQDDSGKYYENGVQFGIARIKAQFDYLNRVFERQNVKAKLRPVYFASASPEIVKYTTAGKPTDFTKIMVCTHFPETDPAFAVYANDCSREDLKAIRDAVFGKVDLVYYIRNIQQDEKAIGIGTYYTGAAFFDGYGIRDSSSGLPSKDIQQDSRFGYRNAAVFLHEFGHVFGAQHQVSVAEPSFPDGSYNRAYACGKQESIPYVAGDLTTHKKTIMWATAGLHHDFFSDPDIIVDGDRCGVPGQANNIETIRKNTWIANNQVMPLPTSTIAIDAPQTVRRDDGYAVVTVRRTGDLSKPAFISLSAKDGSAWEQRDYVLGLQEIKFAAGESEKQFRVTLLQRTQGHSDTKFSFDVHGAIGASFSAVPEVTIVSNKAIQNGQVEFSEGAITTKEGSSAKVTILRKNGTDGDVTFKVSSTNGTASQGVDFTAEPVVKTLKEGETALTLEVPTIKRTGLNGERSLSLIISEVTGGASLGSVAQATVIIQDVPEYGVLNFASVDIAVNENATASLSISRTNGLDGEVKVKVTSVNGSAIAGTDFTAIDQIVTIPAGQSTIVVPVAMVNRPGTQGSRFFDVQLSNVTGGATLGDKVTARVTIADIAEAPTSSGGEKSGGSMSLFVLILLSILILRRNMCKI